MANTSIDRVLIVCDAPPVPPLIGHSRPPHEMIECIRSHVGVDVFAPASAAELDRMARYWGDRQVAVHALPPPTRPSPRRAMLRGWLLPATTRDFKSEAAVVREIAGRWKSPRLLVHFITGAPLLDWFSVKGTVLSGHDCMSRFFRAQVVSANRLAAKCHNLVRWHLAARMERRYGHRAERVHVFTEQDAAAWRARSSRASMAVIPLPGATADSGVLRPMREREGVVVWGSLVDESIVRGLTLFLSAAAGVSGEIRKTWMVVGRLPWRQAVERVPQLATSGVAYVDRVPDISEWLGRTRLVVLPDFDGTGQKNRLIELLAHGCCVAGMAPAFHGVDIGTPPCVRLAHSWSELANVAAGPATPDDEALGRRAMERHRGEFSREVVGRRWFELLQSCHPLDYRPPRSA